MDEELEPKPGEGRTVLIVDDEEAITRAFGSYFERYGYRVIKAANGRQAVSAWRTYEPDVTILDLVLPDMDGIQVMEALRPYDPTVLMLTGHGDIPTAVRALRLGAENFLTKPVEPAHLLTSVERAIEKRDLQRENVRLRRLVPTRRGRMTQAVVVIVLLVVALWVGRMVGGAGPAQRAVPVIAQPEQPPLRSPEQERTDSLLRLRDSVSNPTNR
jgi:FixJ family two-component response regulator